MHNFFNLLFFWNFFYNSSIMLLVASNISRFISKKIFFQQIWKHLMIYNLFWSSFYNAVSVLSTNKLVQNISICNPSVIFVSNHCSPTIFLYPHFLVLQLSSISCNQSILQNLFVYSHHHTDTKSHRFSIFSIYLF